MRRLKLLLILLAVLIAASVAVFLISRHEEKKEQIKNSDEIILTIPKDTVTALSWKYAEIELGVHRGSDNKFLYDGDEAFPVNEDKINELLSVFESFGVSFVIDNVEDFSQYGFSNPEAVIHITAASGTTDVQLGNFSTIDQKRYVSIGDGKVYLVNHDPMEDYKLMLSDLIQHDSIPSAGLSGSTRIAFSGAENYEIRLDRDSKMSSNAEDIYFTDDMPLSNESVGEILTCIRSLSLKDYVSYNATEEELAAYGLDTPDLTITLEYPVTVDDAAATETLVLNLGQNREDLAAANDAAADTETKAADDSESTGDPYAAVRCYVRVGDSQIIYELPNSTYRILAAVSHNDLRHREVLNTQFSQVTGLDVTLDGASYSLTTETGTAADGSTEARTWHYQDKEIENTSALEIALTGLRAEDADSYTDETPSGKEEVSFTVHLDSEQFPTAEIALYRCDGSRCIAVLNGETLCYVPRSEVVSFIEAVNAIVLN